MAGIKSGHFFITYLHYKVLYTPMPTIKAIMQAAIISMFLIIVSFWENEK